MEKQLYNSLNKVLTVFCIVIFTFYKCSPKIEIDNPYSNVDWENEKFYKANFHTHTTKTDGRLNPHSVVDKYHQLGYKILSITDHDEITYPWTEFSTMKPSNTSINRMVSAPESMPSNLFYESRNPKTLKMIDIQGNELSQHHHMGSFFNNHNGTTDVMESLELINLKDGIAMLYHPGRYDESIEWYVDLYMNHDHLIGLEISNQGNRYPNDRAKWDSILNITMPKRPIWGFSNDDMHTIDQVGKNWNVFILPELTHDWVRKGMIDGNFFYVYSPDGHPSKVPALIQSIEVNHKSKSIEIVSNEHDSILWISSGRVVHKGRTIELVDISQNSNYLRAEVYGPNGMIMGTQPFGIKILRKK